MTEDEIETFADDISSFMAEQKDGDDWASDKMAKFLLDLGYRLPVEPAPPAPADEPKHITNYELIKLPVEQRRPILERQAREYVAAVAKETLQRRLRTLLGEGYLSSQTIDAINEYVVAIDAYYRPLLAAAQGEFTMPDQTGLLTVQILNFEDLTPEEQSGASNNGAGKEYATYLKAIHNGKTIWVKNDAMEPEDARFYRDLAWVPKAIEEAYKLGLVQHSADALAKEQAVRKEIGEALENLEVGEPGKWDFSPLSKALIYLTQGEEQVYD